MRSNTFCPDASHAVVVIHVVLLILVGLQCGSFLLTRALSTVIASSGAHKSWQSAVACTKTSLLKPHKDVRMECATLLRFGSVLCAAQASKSQTVFLRRCSRKKPLLVSGTFQHRRGPTSQSHYPVAWYTHVRESRS